MSTFKTCLVLGCTNHGPLQSDFLVCEAHFDSVEHGVTYATDSGRTFVGRTDPFYARACRILARPAVKYEGGVYEARHTLHE